MNAPTEWIPEFGHPPVGGGGLVGRELFGSGDTLYGLPAEEITRHVAACQRYILCHLSEESHKSNFKQWLIFCEVRLVAYGVFAAGVAGLLAMFSDSLAVNFLLYVSPIAVLVKLVVRGSKEWDNQFAHAWRHQRYVDLQRQEFVATLEHFGPKPELSRLVYAVGDLQLFCYESYGADDARGISLELHAKTDGKNLCNLFRGEGEYAHAQALQVAQALRDRMQINLLDSTSGLRWDTPIDWPSK